MPQSRVLPIPNSLNLRELGGYPTATGQRVRTHRLLRSGALSQLTPADAQALWAYGVRTVVDLRSPSEVALNPDVVAPGTAVHALPVYPFDAPTSPVPPAALAAMQDPRITPMAATYLRMLTDPHALAAFRTLFALLTQTRHALLFHCSAGKDRTGVAAMMVLGALGVPRAVIQTDYLLTNLVFGANRETLLAAVQDPTSPLVTALNAHAAETQCELAVHAFITAEFGDWPTYVIQQQLLSVHALTQLRQQLLES
ncbi:tyrosine-protein phosphatase [Lacticaseibacillus daqingensis]|uniref:tyrosine-protein phosphatase n=1 Tax=Lacticaseibacillus daqingensis TaxID=2486014 RepID=UPI000F7706E1|nr:tyrosine-protein phosphatase [Lacticaseibacillus daqingensis]